MALGVFVFNKGKFEAAKDLVINVSADDGSQWAAGVLAQGTGSEAVLNGAVISATEGGTASYAIYTYNNGSVLVMRANIIFTAISLITVAAQLILLLIADRLSRAG